MGANKYYQNEEDSKWENFGWNLVCIMGGFIAGLMLVLRGYKDAFADSLTAAYNISPDSNKANLIATFIFFFVGPILFLGIKAIISSVKKNKERLSA
jgi:hypothetical protein